MRAVLDTNVWLDWLVFDDASIAPLRAAVHAGRVELFIDAACEAELERVLAYPLGKRALDASGQAACLGECRRLAKRIAASARAESALPRCGDPDDQMFLEAAAAAQAHFLLTKDRALLRLPRRRVPFRILTPEAFAGLRDLCAAPSH